MKLLLVVVCFCLTLHLASAALKRVDKKRAMQKRNVCYSPLYNCEEDEDCCLPDSYCRTGVCSCVPLDGDCNYNSDCCIGYCNYNRFCSGYGP